MFHDWFEKAKLNGFIIYSHDSKTAISDTEVDDRGSKLSKVAEFQTRSTFEYPSYKLDRQGIICFALHLLEVVEM